MDEKKPETNGREKQLANLAPPFEKGNPGGPGRPKGSRNLSTLIKDALAAKAPQDYIDKLTARGVTLEDHSWESVLVAIAIGKAASGSIQHLREILDRTEGKARQPIDATVDMRSTVLIGLPPVEEEHGTGKTDASSSETGTEQGEQASEE